MPETPAPSAAHLLARRKRRTVIVLLGIALLGIVVWWNYYIKVTQDEAKGRLAKQGRVEGDPGIFVDLNGKPRKLEELTGKVVVWSYLYSNCGMGCAGIADEMALLQKEFGSNPKFHLISISLYSEVDRPEKLKPWVEIKGFSGDNWWFLTTAHGTVEEGDKVRQWVEKTFGLWARKKDDAHVKENPADAWDHPLGMAVNDHKATIVTPTGNDHYWMPHHEAFQGWYPRDIREDLAILLKEADKD